MASFTVPCPKCLSFSHLGLKSQTQQRNIQEMVTLKKSHSFGSLIRDPASSGIQRFSFMRGELKSPSDSPLYLEWMKILYKPLKKIQNVLAIVNELKSLTKNKPLNRKQFPVWKCQARSNKAVIVESSSNSAPVLVNGPKDTSSEEKDDQNRKPSGPSTCADASSISAFMNQVSDLVKLVDSRDIVELQLKQADCELIIRKKEALEPPPATVVTSVSQPFYYPTYPSPPPTAASASAPASPPPSKAAPALPSKVSTSSHPPLKCPMAGTFYRSPAPGEPAFVKVGDKVQKGQVVCIIEAMKLMNEIEADQSGTITEIRVVCI